MSDEYTQCELRNGDSSHLAWIPTKFAKVGNGLRINDGGEWKNGYVVTACYQSGDKECLLRLSHTHKRFDKILQGH